MNIKLPFAYLNHLARNQHGCIVGYARDSEGRLDGLITLELVVADGVLMSAVAEPADTAYGVSQSPRHGNSWKLVELPDSPLQRAIEYNGMLIALDETLGISETDGIDGTDPIDALDETDGFGCLDANAE